MLTPEMSDYLGFFLAGGIAIAGAVVMAQFTVAAVKMLRDAVR